MKKQCVFYLVLLLLTFLLLQPLFAEETKAPAAMDPAQVEAVIKTDGGNIVIRFFPDAAPMHVANFIKSAGSGAYDGTTFFRVIKYGIIQGGDPLTKDPAARAKYGTGGLNKLKAEFNSHPCARGAVAAVLIPNKPDSAGDQFFICVTEQAQLNGKYTVFGEVVSGMKVVEQISLTPADEKNIATERVVIRKVEVRSIPQPAFNDITVEQLKKYKAVIVTSLGDIEVEFFPDKAPNHVRNFLNFAKAGLYSGTDFHRVVPGFVLQGGATYGRIPPLEEALVGWLKPLKAEFSDTWHEKGILSMARGDDPDSAVDSFFICLGRAQALDEKYTVFGRVTAGLDVVDRIGAVELGENDRPKTRVEIKEIRVVETKQP